MKEPCQFYEGCPLFKFFETSDREVFIKIYCKGDFTDCERRARRMAGLDVPERMLPSGNMLEAIVPQASANDDTVQMVF
ncbi:MAG: hypothetical protein JXJ17_05855 [Anaerolineae bacterium]|nr:hypothetical protein [Anaerolineae bacterium]